MKWIIEWHESYTVLRFQGDLMVGATQFFETGVMPWMIVPFAPLILDLSDMKIIVSAGLSVLLKIRKAATEAKVHLVLVKPAQEAWKALEMTRLDTLFPITDTVEDAVKVIKRKSR
jgi:anti-anti-sigma factor